MIKTEFQYQLDKGSKKHRCPGCQRKRFVRYVDVETDEFLPERFGRCDREVNCGYHLSPYHDNNFEIDSSYKPDPKPKPDPVFIKPELLRKSKGNYRDNVFIQWLATVLPVPTIKKLIKRYHIGTSRQLQGGAIFWQVDKDFKIHRGKIIVYGSDGHKKYFGSVHKQLGIQHDEYPPVCWFGSHLLTNSNKPVAIVESEKTAIIASAFYSYFTWIATTSLSLLKPEYATAIIGRDVVLFPDLGATERWKEKAQNMKYFCNMRVSNYLESIATPEQREAGLDIADFLIRDEQQPQI